MSYWLRRCLFSHSRSRPVTVKLPEATQGPSTGNWLSQSVPLFFLRPPPPLYLCPSPAILIWHCRIVIVLIAPHLPRWIRDRDSTEFRTLYLFVLSAGPTCCLCSHEVGTKFHITCFFTSTIRLRPRLSRALLLSLFSMPDKLESDYIGTKFYY